MEVAPPVRLRLHDDVLWVRTPTRPFLTIPRTEILAVEARRSNTLPAVIAAAAIGGGAVLVGLGYLAVQWFASAMSGPGSGSGSASVFDDGWTAF